MHAIDGEFEIIFVDDGSADNSWDILTELKNQNPEHIVAVQLMRNYGQHNALMCGFRHTSGQYIITMDDDLQNPPEEIPKLINAIMDGGLDLVYGYAESKKHKKWRNAGTWLIRFFYRTIFKSAAITTSFRIIERSLLESIFAYDLNYTYVDGLFAWNSKDIGNVKVEHHSRGSGQSGYSLSKLFVLALNLFTNFSLLPLQLASGFGFLAAILGFITGGYYLIQYLLSGIAVPGFASTIIAVLVLGGSQLLALGIIGEYVGRMHLNVNRKPQYTVRKLLDNNKN
jgi:undecaprenyl-phosphate 4-deoxy-4-formamido-L-arabinose transferase